MLDRTKPMTHVAWAPYYAGGRFRKWVEVGEGRIDVDGDGKAAAHVYNDRHAYGGSTYSCLLPIGVRPPEPKPQAKRPDRPDDGEEDLG